MTSRSLEAYHLLVTRPEAQAQVWAKQLQALGATVSVQSMMVIQALGDSQAKQQILNHVLAFDHYNKAIFISQNAVSYGLYWLDQYWPQLPIGVEFFAIGQATASALECNTTAVDIYSAKQAMNSESLLEHDVFQHVDGEKIIIFRGQGGRNHLGEELRKRGATVDYCELYQRLVPSERPLSIDPLFKETDKTAIITVHSGETLENLCRIIEKDDLLWLQQQVILLPGQRVAEQAAGAGFSRCIVAQNATHHSMIEALYDWQR